MKASDYQTGQKVTIVGRTYHGYEGRVHHTGNGAVFVLGRFGKGGKNPEYPRGFMPEDVRLSDTEEAAVARYSKHNKEEIPYNARYGGADVVS
jgi:hypothetical protein